MHGEETWNLKVRCSMKQVCTGINASAEDLGEELKAVGGCAKSQHSWHNCFQN